MNRFSRPSAKLTSPDEWEEPELRDLDYSLRCSICFEYFHTAMMLSCSHNFCSVCIRRHIEYKGNKSLCPLCGEPAETEKLSNNRLLDQIVRQFTTARRVLKGLKRIDPNETTELLKNDDVEEKKAEALPKSSTQSDTVSCPACGAAVIGRSINAHLDRCLEEKVVKERAKHQSKRKANFAIKRLPKLVYTPALLSDRDLNKKLTELGLPTAGNRQAKVKRHRDFTLMYNAELDCENPRSMREVAKEYLRIENAKSTVSEEKVDRCEEGREEYLQKHRKSFDELVKNVKKRGRRGRKARKIDSDTETEENTTNNSKEGESSPSILQPASPKISEENSFDGTDLLKSIPPNLTQIMEATEIEILEDDHLTKSEIEIDVIPESPQPNESGSSELLLQDNDDDFDSPQPKKMKRNLLRKRKSQRKPTRYS